MADSPSTTLINPTETYFFVGSVQVVVALHDHLVHLLHQIGWENGSEGLEVLSAESVGVPQSFLLRMFNRYVEAHDIPTAHIFWLKLRKNNMLFVYELIRFVNHNLLDILRLVNIGMMTIACGRAGGV